MGYKLCQRVIKGKIDYSIHTLGQRYQYVQGHSDIQG